MKKTKNNDDKKSRCPNHPRIRLHKSSGAPVDPDRHSMTCPLFVSPRFLWTHLQEGPHSVRAPAGRIGEKVRRIEKEEEDEEAGGLPSLVDST